MSNPPFQPSLSDRPSTHHQAPVLLSEGMFLNVKPLVSHSKTSPKLPTPQTLLPQRERLRLLAIGSPEGVTAIIHTLHQRGFAEVGAWSPLLPTPNPSEVMSILTRYRLVPSEGK